MSFAYWIMGIPAAIYVIMRWYKPSTELIGAGWEDRITGSQNVVHENAGIGWWKCWSWKSPGPYLAIIFWKIAIPLWSAHIVYVAVSDRVSIEVIKEEKDEPVDAVGAIEVS